MSAYSEDLRRRIVDAVGDGMSKARAARTFRVSLSSVKRYVDKAQGGQSLAPKKRPGAAPKKRPEGDEAARRGPPRTPLRHPAGALRVRRGRDGALGEPLHDVPRHSPLRPHQEKGGRSATQRDEFLRAAWRLMVTAKVAPERLVFLRTNAGRTPRWRRSTDTRLKASDCAFGCPGGGARTPRCYLA